MDKSKSKREYRYKVIVAYKDDNGQFQFAKYHNIYCDRTESWAKTKAFFKQKYPTATHCNIYGGVTGGFKKQEKFE